MRQHDYLFPDYASIKNAQYGIITITSYLNMLTKSWQ